MTALKEQLTHVHLGVARLQELRVRFHEAVKLLRGISQKLFTRDQVVRRGSLIDQGAPFLVVEHVLDRRRELGVTSEHLDVMFRVLVQARLSQLLQELKGRSRIFTRLGPGASDAKSKGQPDQNDPFPSEQTPWHFRILHRNRFRTNHLARRA